MMIILLIVAGLVTLTFSDPQYYRESADDDDYRRGGYGSEKFPGYDRWHHEERNEREYGHEDYGIGKRPVYPGALFPKNEGGKGILNLSDNDLETLYEWIENGSYYYAHSEIERKLYDFVPREIQRELHGLAGLFTNDGDVRLRDLLKINDVLKDKISKLPKKIQAEIKETLLKLFGREVIIPPSTSNHFFEAEIIVIAIIIILW